VHGAERDGRAPAAVERGQPSGARALLHRHHLPHVERAKNRAKPARGKNKIIFRFLSILLYRVTQLSRAFGSLCGF
jgi:hypothetical protein